MSLRTFRFMLCLVLAGATACWATAAHADCSQPATDFDAGLCAAAEFHGVDAELNQTYQQLLASLPADRQDQLRQSELAWMQRRDRDCLVTVDGKAYINFDCATEIERQHLQALQAQLEQPPQFYPQRLMPPGIVPPPPLQHPEPRGTIYVPGSAMPWLSQPDGINSAYPFGLQDGSAPVVVPLAALHVDAGQAIMITYISGMVNTGGVFPPSDANGTNSPYSDGGDGSSGNPFPSDYMHPYPIQLGALVGTFADASGDIVGTPFAIGDGPAEEIVPPGAARLQLGVNDDIYGPTNGAANTGYFVVRVTSQKQPNMPLASFSVRP